MKILFISNEVTPFSSTDETSDIANDLPKALKAQGHEVRIVTPRYTTIRERKFGLRDVARLKSIEIKIGGLSHECAVKSGFLTGSKVQVYFVDSKKVYDKPIPSPVSVKIKIKTEYQLRIAMLNHTALQLMMLLGWTPDIIHCNGWQTALLPFLLRNDPLYKDHFDSSRTSFNLHAVENVDTFDQKVAEIFGITASASELKKYFVHESELNLLKAGLKTSDLIISPDHDKTKESLKKVGLEKLLMRKPSERVTYHTISDGIDIAGWNPATDNIIDQQFEMETLEEGKSANKRSLIDKFDIKFEEGNPVILVDLNGKPVASIGELKNLLNGLDKFEASFIFTYRGEENFLKSLERNVSEILPDATVISEDSDKALHQIEAGSDITFLPFESAHMRKTQAYSMIYGSVPVVARTDQDDALVNDFSNGKGNGFVFEEGDINSAIAAVSKAIDVYHNKDKWNKLRSGTMGSNYSWDYSASLYSDIYMDALSNPPYQA